MAVFCYHLTPPFLTWTIIRPDGTAVPPTPVEGVARPSLVHNMALTEHYLVLVVAPLFSDIGAALTGGSLLTCEPEQGTRVALIPHNGGPTAGGSPSPPIAPQARAGCSSYPPPPPRRARRPVSAYPSASRSVCTATGCPTRPHPEEPHDRHRHPHQHRPLLHRRHLRLRPHGCEAGSQRLPSRL